MVFQQKSDELARKIEQDIDFQYVFGEYLSDLYKNVKFPLSIDKEVINQEPNDIIVEKNSATSTIAGLLGCNNIIAHCENVIVKNGDKSNTGVIMDFVNGYDYSSHKINDLLTVNSNLDINNTSLKKQLSSLQVIDYICGNFDRHAGNMIYQTKDNKVIGIVGIDNDFSFPQNNELLTPENRNPGLSNLKYIDEKLANHIMLLSEDVLSLALKEYNINSAAIKDACNRLNLLKTILANSLNPSKEIYSFLANKKIQVLDDTGWEQTEFSQFAKEDVKYFYTVEQVFTNGKNLDDLKNTMSSNIQSAKTKVITDIRCLASDSKDLQRQMSNATSIFRGSSNLYKTIQEELKLFTKNTNDLKYNYSKEFPEEYLKKAVNLQKLTQQYLDSKEQLPKLSGYTKNRVDVVKSLNDMVNKVIYTASEGFADVEKESINLENLTKYKNSENNFEVFEKNEFLKKLTIDTVSVNPKVLSSIKENKDITIKNEKTNNK